MGAFKREDEHASCREAISRAYASRKEQCVVAQVVQQLPFGKGHIVLKVLRVDTFEDGLLRILVE